MFTSSFCFFKWFKWSISKLFVQYCLVREWHARWSLKFNIGFGQGEPSDKLASPQISASSSSILQKTGDLLADIRAFYFLKNVLSFLENPGHWMLEMEQNQLEDVSRRDQLDRRMEDGENEMHWEVFFSLQVWLFSFFLFGKECNLMFPKGFQKRFVAPNISMSCRMTKIDSFWTRKKRDLLLRSQPTV